MAQKKVVTQTVNAITEAAPGLTDKELRKIADAAWDVLNRRADEKTKVLQENADPVKKRILAELKVAKKAMIAVDCPMDIQFGAQTINLIVKIKPCTPSSRWDDEAFLEMTDVRPAVATKNAIVRMICMEVYELLSDACEDGIEFMEKACPEANQQCQDFNNLWNNARNEWENLDQDWDEIRDALPKSFWH